MNAATRSKLPLVAVLPTSLTLGNAVCGFAAISYATQSEAEPSALHPLCTAGLLILLAMVFDALDGAVARLTQQTSAFGAQLDSLCDLVSFGVAPAVLLMNFPHTIPSRLLWCIALLYVLCAAMRLARYNADQESEGASNCFCGLPSPAAAGAIASLTLIEPKLRNIAAAGAPRQLEPISELLALLAPVVAPWLVLLLACLMISKVRYPHPFKDLLHGKRPMVRLVQAYFILVAAFAIHELALPLILFVFALAFPLRAAILQLVAGIARSTQIMFLAGK